MPKYPASTNSGSKKAAGKKPTGKPHKGAAARPGAKPAKQGYPKNRDTARDTVRGERSWSRDGAGDRDFRARDDRPRDDRPRDDRPRADRPRDDRPRADRPRADRPRDDRPRADRPRDDRPRADRPRDDRRDDRPRYDRDDRPRTDRPRYDRDDRPRNDRPRDDRPRDDRPRDDRPRDDRPRDDRPRFERNDRPRTDRPRDDRPRDDRPRFERGPKSGGPRRERPVRNLELTGPSGFTALGVPDRIAAILQADGINDPFPIQEATIPDAMGGRDVLGRGRTGSGKTLAFGLPLICQLAGGSSPTASPRGLILVPTRELAMQVRDALTPLAEVVGMSISLVIGGASYVKQINGLRRADIVVATPGRLSDLINQGACNLDHVSISVLDEADQMADMGFLPQVEELLEQTPEGQRLLFSATLDRGVDGLVKRYLNNPVEHATDPDTASVTTMEHHIFVIDPRDKKDVIAEIASRRGSTIFFVRTQLGAERVAGELEDAGVRNEVLHGGKTQNARIKALARFKEGSVRVLVATDVAARGIHVDGIDLVVHIDPPQDPKDYLHRAGRTARAGESGSVVTLTTPRQKRFVDGLTGKAGVSPTVTRVRPGSRELEEITGSRPAARSPRDTRRASGPAA